MMRKGSEFTEISELSPTEQLSLSVVKLLGSGVSTERIASILGAEKYLKEKNGTLSFDVKSWIAETLANKGKVTLPEKTHKIEDVILPTVSTNIIKVKPGEWKEADEIPRTALMIDVLTELNIKYQLITGNVSKDMIRNLPYVAFHIPEIEKVVLICNEQNNASFILHELPEDLLKFLTETTKDDLRHGNNEMPVSIVEFRGTIEKWKREIKNALLLSDINEIDSQDDQVEIADVPNPGWLTARGIQKELGAGQITVTKLIHEILPETEGQSQKARSSIGIYTYYSPEILKEVNDRLPPKGWITGKEISLLLGMSQTTFKKEVATYIAESGSEESIQKKVFKRTYYSPEIISAIKIRLEKREPEEGWMNIADIVRDTGSSRDALRKALKDQLVGMSEKDLERSVKTRSSKGKRPSPHYSPKIIEGALDELTM